MNSHTQGKGNSCGMDGRQLMPPRCAVAVLLINAVAVLSEDRFLARCTYAHLPSNLLLLPLAQHTHTHKNLEPDGGEPNTCGRSKPLTSLLRRNQLRRRPRCERHRQDRKPHSQRPDTHEKYFTPLFYNLYPAGGTGVPAGCIMLLTDGCSFAPSTAYRLQLGHHII